eukprot:TRINITY_DN13754_c0_g1_i1.p1 TRINITY_DN13754_c0_g1~~TRINITY_DN13754_c0_g1_i1.p1  ORF type:complete len:1108 (-),score=88.57 TRINITY_DN13754_c0_g1_i1:154-3405(-)
MEKRFRIVVLGGLMAMMSLILSGCTDEDQGNSEINAPPMVSFEATMIIKDPVDFDHASFAAAMQDALAENNTNVDVFVDKIDYLFTIGYRFNGTLDSGAVLKTAVATSLGVAPETVSVDFQAQRRLLERSLSAPELVTANVTVVLKYATALTGVAERSASTDALGEVLKDMGVEVEPEIVTPGAFAVKAVATVVANDRSNQGITTPRGEALASALESKLAVEIQATVETLEGVSREVALLTTTTTTSAVEFEIGDPGTLCGKMYATADDSSAKDVTSAELCASYALRYGLKYDDACASKESNNSKCSALPPHCSRGGSTVIYNGRSSGKARKPERPVCLKLWEMVGWPYMRCVLVGCPKAASRADCQQRAERNNHTHYDYEYSRGCCKTFNRCDRPGSEVNNRWRMYQAKPNYTFVRRATEGGCVDTNGRTLPWAEFKRECDFDCCKSLCLKQRDCSGFELAAYFIDPEGHPKLEKRPSICFLYHRVIDRTRALVGSPLWHVRAPEEYVTPKPVQHVYLYEDSARTCYTRERSQFLPSPIPCKRAFCPAGFVPVPGREDSVNTTFQNCCQYEQGKYLSSDGKSCTYDYDNNSLRTSCWRGQVNRWGWCESLKPPAFHQTEILHLTAFDNALFAGTGTWMKPHHSPGGILKLECPTCDWKSHLTFKFAGRAEVLKVITWTTDLNGQLLQTPVNMLVTGYYWNVGQVRSEYYYLVGGTSDWKGPFVYFSEPYNYYPDHYTSRSLALHKDAVTGKELLLFPAGRPGVVSGQYDPNGDAESRKLYRLKYSSLIRFGKFVEKPRDSEFFPTRPLCMAQLGGRVFMSSGRAVWVRRDGRDAYWEAVFDMKSMGYIWQVDAAAGGIRGLTTIRHESGRGHSMLFQWTPGGDSRVPHNGCVIRLDPVGDVFRGTREMCVNTYVQIWIQTEVHYSIAAYNNFVEVPIPNGKFAYVTGFQAMIGTHLTNAPWNPDQHGKNTVLTKPEARFLAAAGILTRWGPGEWSVSFVGGPRTKPDQVDPKHTAARCMTMSPFRGETAMMYWGGHDCNFYVSKNTAWIYKGTLAGVLTAHPQLKARDPKFIELCKKGYVKC